MVKIKKTSYFSTREDTNFLPPLYTCVEVAFAVTRQGYKLLAIEEGLIYPQMEYRSRATTGRSQLVAAPLSF